MPHSLPAFYLNNCRQQWALVLARRGFVFSKLRPEESTNHADMFSREGTHLEAYVGMPGDSAGLILH